MKALKGIKIADFSWTGVGPATARYFADHGATVVKVENIDHPDILRVTALDLRSSWFWAPYGGGAGFSVFPDSRAAVSAGALYGRA